MVAAAEAPPPRHHGEVSMESFIKNQMMIILQPFIEHVQHLDTQMTRFQEQLDQSDRNGEGLRNGLGETHTMILDLEGCLKKVDARVAGLREGVDKCQENHELLHQGVENTNGWMQRIQNQAEGTAGVVPELQRSIGDLEARLQALSTNLQRTNDIVAHDCKGALDRLGGDLQDLKADCGRSNNDFERLKEDFLRKSQLLQESRAMLDKNVATTVNLQRNHDLQSTREADMRRLLDGLKSQSSKLQSSLEAVNKDATFLKQRQEHLDDVLHTLQQNHATMHCTQEQHLAGHDKLSREVQGAQQHLSTTREQLEDTRAAMSRANAFTNSLHAGLDKVSGDLTKTNQRIEGLESKHSALSEQFDKSCGAMAELRCDQRRTAADTSSVRHELDKTNEAVLGTKCQLDAAGEKLGGLVGELGRTNEAVQRLEGSMDLCRAGFAGLQKGFVETGAHIASRPLTLPKLSRDDRPSRTSPKSNGVGGSTFSKPPLTARASIGEGCRGVNSGNEFVSTWLRSSEDLDSTQASLHSMTSRKTSYVSDC